MTDATHREVKKPQISVRHLAEYMASSERVRRSILRKCKYQSIIPVTQHRDAKILIANHIRSGKGDLGELKKKIETLSHKICDSDFEEKQLKHNVDYLNRFCSIHDKVELPKAEVLPAKKLEPLIINKTKVNFSPDLLMMRVTKTNAVKIGAICFRYAKGTSLEAEVAAYHAAFAFSYLRSNPFETEAEPEHKLCLVVDNYAGITYSAPTNSVNRFNDMSAACNTISDAWAAIEPPPSAILS